MLQNTLKQFGESAIKFERRTHERKAKIFGVSSFFDLSGTFGLDNIIQVAIQYQ